MGLCQLDCGVQPLHQLTRGKQQGQALQPAVQHEHVLPDVGRDHPCRSQGEDRRAEGRSHCAYESGRCKRATQLGRTGANAYRQGHLRETDKRLYREAMGTEMYGASGFHHQEVARASGFRQ